VLWGKSDAGLAGERRSSRLDERNLMIRVTGEEKKTFSTLFVYGTGPRTKNWEQTGRSDLLIAERTRKKKKADSLTKGAEDRSLIP